MPEWAKIIKRSTFIKITKRGPKAWTLNNIHAALRDYQSVTAGYVKDRTKKQDFAAAQAGVIVAARWRD